MKIEVVVLKVNEFTSKKGTQCACIWAQIKGGMLPMYKIFVFDDASIAKAKSALASGAPLLFGIGAGSDMVPRLEIL